jgi:hypothetical protein
MFRSSHWFGAEPDPPAAPASNPRRSAREQLNPLTREKFRPSKDPEAGEEWA